MTKKFGILQKKVKELESDVNQVVSLLPETPRHQRFSQEIQQRFLFVKNLLSAEIASRPRKPHHLQHLVQRLLELESTFQEWDNFQTSAPLEKGNSTCSCTESCLIDDEGSSDEILMSFADHMEQVAEASSELSLAGLDLDSDSEGFDSEDGLLFPAVAENKTEEGRVRVEEERSMMMKKQKTNPVWFGKCFGSMATGVVLGMVLMAFFMLKYCACFHCCYAFDDTDSTFTLTPT